MGRRPSSAEVPQKQQLLLRRKPQHREQQVFGSRLRSMQGPVQDSSHRSRRSATLSPALSKRTSPRVQVDATPSSAKAPKSTERKSKRPSKSVRKEEINGEEELVGIIDGHDASSGRVEEDTKKEESAEIEAEENAQGQAEGDANGEAEEENESDEEDYEEEEESEGDVVGEVLGEGFYEVETVRRKRVRKGQVQYFIKWRGWPESANTWEPYDNVKACADIIEDFEKSHMVKQTRRGRGKRKLGTYISPQDKGTYTSPQMKKRSSTSNGAKGSSATNTGKEPEGPGNGVEKQATEVPAAISEIPAIQAVADPTVSIGKESQAKINIFTGNKSNSGSGEVDLDQFALAFEEGSKSEGSQVKLTVSSLPKDCVMANVITSEEEMQSGPSFATIVNRELSQKTHSKEETKSPSSFTSAETAMVCLAESSVPNGICDAKEESHVAEVVERQRLSAADLVMRETKTSTKKLTNHSATPGTEKRASEPAGKTTSDDKYTGAKKRKQGFVRRVRQSLDSQEHEMKQRPIEEGEKESQQIFEESNVVNNGEAVIQEGDGSMLKATNQQGHQSSHFEQIQAPQDSDMPPSQVPPSLPLDTGTTFQITEIVKAVSYSNSMANGKQDASVLFKVLRSDGQESMVDNKFLRANHPLLLIDFYEQHLRYSTSQ